MDSIAYDIETTGQQMQHAAFEELYTYIRKQEQRILTDEQVSRLPVIERSHIHYNEWVLRKRSADRLVKYLAKKERSLRILEIGCGNGWLAAYLANNVNSRVIGLDINLFEIEQAKSVFKNKNLEFIGDSFSPELFSHSKFDVILFAASIQYFPQIDEIITNALACLTATGEIHIMDTHFYKSKGVTAARERTTDHYMKMGCPEMAAHYYHHSITDIGQFEHKLLTNPDSLVNRFYNREPFYWLTIKH